MDQHLRYLSVYLSDHHAGSVAAQRLVDRIIQENRSEPFVESMKILRTEFEEDAVTLERVLDALALSRSKLKDGLARVATELGRTKLNGHLLRYSPLSRVLEIEGLIAGVQAKQALWDTLAVIALDDRRLGDFDFAGLRLRAANQLERLTEIHRLAAQRLGATRAPEARAAAPGA